MLLVKVKHADDADDLFAKLMGDPERRAVRGAGCVAPTIVIARESGP
jgi:hypothetical protein